MEPRRDPAGGGREQRSSACGRVTKPRCSQPGGSCIWELQRCAFGGGGQRRRRAAYPGETAARRAPVSFFFSTRRAPIIAAVNCVSLKVIGSYGAVFSFPAGRQWLSAVLNVNQRVSAETCAVGSRRNGFTPAAPRSPQYSAAPGRERAGVPLRKRSCRRTWKALNRDGGEGGRCSIVLLLGTVAQPRSARTGMLGTTSQGCGEGGHPAAGRALCLEVASSTPGTAERGRGRKVPSGLGPPLRGRRSVGMWCASPLPLSPR